MEPSTVVESYVDAALPALSLSSIAWILVVSLPLAVVSGYLLGAVWRGRLLRQGQEIDTAVGQSTSAALMAILGLLLAFSYSGSLNISQSVKQAIVNEAAALGTVFSRADYLPEPGRTDLQRAILEYAQTRVLPPGERLDTREKAKSFISRSMVAQSRLWPLTLEATRDPVSPPIQAFVASAMNAALDAHLYRMATLAVPVSAYAHGMVLASALATLFILGNRSGMIGRRLGWRTVLLVLFLGVLMYVLVDIRRGSDGLIRVQGTMMDTTILEMDRELRSRG